MLGTREGLEQWSQGGYSQDSGREFACCLVKAGP